VLSRLTNGRLKQTKKEKQMNKKNEKSSILEGMIKELKSGGPELMGAYGPLWWIVIYIGLLATISLAVIFSLSIN